MMMKLFNLRFNNTPSLEETEEPEEKISFDNAYIAL